MMEDALGLTFEHPAEHLREYLAVLAPLLAGERRLRSTATATGSRPPSTSRVPRRCRCSWPRWARSCCAWPDG